MVLFAVFVWPRKEKHNSWHGLLWKQGCGTFAEQAVTWEMKRRRRRRKNTSKFERKRGVVGRLIVG